MTKKVTNDTNCEFSAVQELCFADLKEVLEIEKQSFSDPWEPAFFESELKNSNSICLKLCDGEKLVSYIIARTIFDEVHVLNIATAPSYRNKGAAKKLMEHVINNLCSGKLLLLEVRDSNESARKFYEGFGFKELYNRKAYYADGEDAVVMIRTASKTKDHNAVVIKIDALLKKGAPQDIVSMWLEVKSLEFDAGQFLMLEVPGFPLRRPFVIADKDDDKIRIIFKLRGKGTAALKEIKPG
ncbi:MAG: ribosomal protein S18-alanine N-acetyltransferase, partial [Pseudomonadota bacterium]